MIIKYYADVDDDYDDYDYDYDCDDDYYWRLVWLTMRRFAVAATSSNRLRQLRPWDLGHAPHVETEIEMETETQNETETGSASTGILLFYSILILSLFALFF